MWGWKQFIPERSISGGDIILLKWARNSRYLGPGFFIASTTLSGDTCCDIVLRLVAVDIGTFRLSVDHVTANGYPLDFRVVARSIIMQERYEKLSFTFIM